MAMIDDLKADLIRDEGIEPSMYLDSEGYATIGVGHLIDKRRGGRIPSTIIDSLLDYDIQQDIQQAQTHLWYTTLDTDNRRRALLNMVFNLGSLGVCKFSNFVEFLEEKNWKAAADDLRTTLWAKQVGDRAERIAVLIENG